jgi:hypothetical protein
MSAPLRMTPFWRGLKNIWSNPKNTGRSKKSQALWMTLLCEVQKDIAKQAIIVHTAEI